MGARGLLLPSGLLREERDRRREHLDAILPHLRQAVKFQGDTLEKVNETVISEFGNMISTLSSIYNWSLSDHVRTLGTIRNMDMGVLHMQDQMSRVANWSQDYASAESTWRNFVADAFKQLGRDFTRSSGEIERLGKLVREEVLQQAAEEQRGDDVAVLAAAREQQNAVAGAGRAVGTEVGSARKATRAISLADMQRLQAILNELNMVDTMAMPDDLEPYISRTLDRLRTIRPIFEGVKAHAFKRVDEARNQLANQTDRLTDRLQSMSFAQLGGSASMEGGGRDVTLDGRGVASLLARGRSLGEVHAVVQSRHQRLMQKLRALYREGKLPRGAAQQE